MTQPLSDLAPREKHRLTVDEFLMLDEAGAFAGRSTELFDGEVFYMNAKHRPHARTITQLVVALARALEASDLGLGVLTDVSVRISDHDCPEPDLVLTSEPDGDSIVPVATVALVIEVADSTLRTDLGLKASLYARAGVSEYWVADVAGQVLHQMWSPAAEGYAERREVALGGPITAVTIPGLSI